LALALLLVAAPTDAARAQRSSGQPARAAPGLDAALAARTVERAAALPQLRSLIVARGGRPLIERVFRGPSLDTPVNIKSASKTLL
jgi:CubicO group peptidase (beta-lactamase class C family)